MKLIPNKRIGKVLYLVEGDVDEISILEHIFKNVLGYSVVEYDKRHDNVRCFLNKNDKYSKVFIVPMKYSAISKIESSTEYVDFVYNKLKSFGLEKDECSKYLIFDRDNKSNKHETFEHLFKIFKNSLDNDLEINGLLLVSYPCVQSFICQCFNDQIRLTSSASMKQYVGCHNMLSIGSSELLVGAEQMMKIIINILELPFFDIGYLDNMEPVNNSILNHQDSFFAKNNVYITLSLLFISFIDLGIIEI